MSEEVKTLGEAPPPLNDLLPRTVKNYSVTHPPPPSFWVHPCSPIPLSLPPHSRADKSVPDVVVVIDATWKQSLGAMEDIDQQALLSFDQRYPLVIDEGHDSLGNEKSNSVSGAS